jgi:heterodisulfide reductase subunit D
MTFDYAAYYRRTQELEALQIPANAIHWVERYQRPAARAEVVLYLGCNILRTPDIAADVVGVFRTLGIDFVAVAGAQFCCGITWDRHGDVEPGQAVSASTIERLASYRPGLVVHWCPSCDVHMSDVVVGRDQRVLPFPVTSAAAFLAKRARAGQMPWRQAVTGRAALHGHRGREGHEQGQRRAREDTEQVGSLLRTVPGVEYLGVVESPPELDYDCGPSSTTMDRARWRALRAEEWSRLVATKADLVVTKSHACQREWCDLATADVAVRCWISIVADALGWVRDYPSNPLAEMKAAAGDAAELVTLTRRRWASHGWSEEEASGVVARYDWSGGAPELPSP